MGKVKAAMMAKQYKLDLYYLRIAGLAAANSVDPSTRVGCIIVNGGAIVSDGWNGTPSGFHTNETRDEYGEAHAYVVHAEANALAKCARLGHATQNATMYINTGPCPDCVKIIKQAGITRVVYAKPYRMASGPAMLEDMGIIVDHIDPELENA